MKGFTKVSAPMVAAAALLVAGNLSAAPGTETGTTEPAATTAPKATLTAEQMKERSNALIEQQRQDTLLFQHLQAQARGQKDVIKLSCVNDKLVQFKAQSNEVDIANNELLGSLGDGRRVDAYERLTVVANAAHVTAETAKGCVGATEYTETGAEFTAPEITDDPTKGLPFEIKVEPPAYASPFA